MFATDAVIEKLGSLFNDIFVSHMRDTKQIGLRSEGNIFFLSIFIYLFGCTGS